MTNEATSADVVGSAAVLPPLARGRRDDPVGVLLVRSGSGWVASEHRALLPVRRHAALMHWHTWVEEEEYDGGGTWWYIIACAECGVIADDDWG
jgi:hypothetical protein